LFIGSDEIAVATKESRDPYPGRILHEYFLFRANCPRLKRLSEGNKEVTCKSSGINRLLGKSS